MHIFERYGKVQSGIIKGDFPSGFKDKLEANGFDAFATFFHPSSKYQGLGTEGRFARELIMSEYPPGTQRPIWPKKGQFSA